MQIRRIKLGQFCAIMEGFNCSSSVKNRVSKYIFNVVPLIFKWCAYFVLHIDMDIRCNFVIH